MLSLPSPPADAVLLVCSQLFGLLMSFCSFGIFLSVKPFLDRFDNVLEIICQLSIFLAMLLGLVMHSQPVGFMRSLVDVTLCTCAIAPTTAAVTFSTPAFDYLRELYQKRHRRKEQQLQKQRETERSTSIKNRQVKAATQEMSTRFGEMSTRFGKRLKPTRNFDDASSQLPLRSFIASSEQRAKDEHSSEKDEPGKVGA